MRRKLLFCLFLLLAAKAIADNVWTPLGSFGQTVTRIAFSPANPGLIFFSGNDVFRSTDHGVSWERSATNISGRILIHPAHPERILLFGPGVFESVDEGLSWKRIADINLEDVAFHSSNPQILYGADRRGRIYTSLDGGITWNPGGVLGIRTRCCSAIAVDPHNGQTLYVAAVSGGLPVTVVKSTDAGRSFSIQSPRGILKTANPNLAMDPLRSNTFYLSSATEILKSENGGRDWSRINGFVTNFPPECECTLNGLSIDPFSNDIYAAVNPGSTAGDPFLIRSQNGGTTWKKLSVPIQTQTSPLIAPAFHPSKQKQIFTSAGEGVLRSNDGGNSWKRFKQGLKGLFIQDVEAHPADRGTLYAVFAGSLYESKNGSAWKFITPSGFESFRIFDFVIHPRHPNLWFAGGIFFQSGKRGNFIISEDAGKHWRMESPADSASILAVDPIDPEVIYIANPLLKSTDGGRTWNRLNLRTFSGITEFVIDPVQTRNLFAIVNRGNRRSLFVSTDAGASWRQDGFIDFVESIVVTATRPVNKYAVVRVGRKYFAAASDVVGNWGRFFELPGQIVGSDPWTGDIDVDPSNLDRIFIAADLGLFVSENQGISYGSFDLQGLTGYKRARLTKILIHSWNSNKLIAATHDGIFSYPETESGSPQILALSQPVTEPSGWIEIIGSGFGSSQSNSRVFLGDQDAGTAGFWSDRSITIQIPANLNQASVPVIVQVNSNSSDSVQLVLEPSAGNIFPVSGTAGTTVSLKARFEGLRNPRIRFGEFVVTDFSEITDRNVVANAPPGSGTVSVFVISDTRDPIDLGTFTYE